MLEKEERNHKSLSPMDPFTRIGDCWPNNKSSVQTQDVLWKTCQEQWMIGTNGERESQGNQCCQCDTMVSLSLSLSLYIYIYIYIWCAYMINDICTLHVYDVHGIYVYDIYVWYIYIYDKWYKFKCFQAN